MNNNTKAKSFWNFLKENTIEIPIIQRDYAQGRLGKESLRKNFLRDLKNALDAEDTIEMKLDFVYGSTEKCKMNPLDGQQRLTTLWLLHWYIALRAGKLNEENCKLFQRFTYETRISSREFCENLCNPKHFEKFDGNDIVGYITKQTWFYSAWKQDPTIQSMLRMLGGTKINDKNGDDIIDGIEELFDSPSECDIRNNTKCLLLRVFHKYWNKMTSDDCPIVFYHLPLQDFGLSDDLYIKMNARGKQLTSFENFKADLIGYITKQSENEQAEWKELLDPESGIPIKLDTDWTDIFWKNKSKGITDNESKIRKANQIDEIYFTFLNRFFWNELFIAKNSDKYILDIGKGDESSTQENNNPSYKYLNNSEHDNDTTIAYEGLDFYRYDNGEIPLSFFQKLKRVLDNFFTYSKEKDLPECPWNTSFRFIPKYQVENDNNIEITNNANDKILGVSTLNQVQRIVFLAICKYFDHDNNISDNEGSLKQWMRVVWNLVSGEDHNGRPEIRSTSAMRTAIEFINSLDPHNVYNSLAERNVSGATSFEERCKEEIAKAKQILNGSQRSDGGSWEETIKKAERYSFFKGTIRFLFTNEEGESDWSETDFDTKWKNAQIYFDKEGVADGYKDNAILLRYYISEFKEWGEFWEFNYDNKSSTWKQLLISKRNKANHIILMNLLDKGHDFSSFISSLKIYDNEYKELQEMVQNELVKTNILFKSSEWSMKLNWRNNFNCYCLYPYNTKASWKIYVIANKRNQILSQLHNNGVIKTENRIKDCDFFWGWDIPFEYDNFNFQWNIDGFIYLMDNDKNKEPKEEYCINANELENANRLIQKMDELIKHKSTNE